MTTSKSTARKAAPITKDDTRKAVTTLQQSVVLLILSIRAPGNVRMVRDKSALKTDADKSQLGITKRLIESIEADKIHVLDGTIRAYVKRIALPSPFRKSSHAIPLALLRDVDQKLTAFAAERETLVEKYADVYTKAVAIAEEKLRQFFKKSDYLTRDGLRAAYTMEWQYVALSAPDQMMTIDSQLFKREQKRLSQKWDDAVGEMQDALRVGLGEMVTDMTERLKAATDKDGEVKRFKPSKLLQRFEEFLTTFAARNVTGDEQLEALAAQARAVLKGVNAENLTQVDTVRASVAKGFKEIQATINKLEVEARGRRRIKLED